MLQEPAITYINARFMHVHGRPLCSRSIVPVKASNLARLRRGSLADSFAGTVCFEQTSTMASGRRVVVRCILLIRESLHAPPRAFRL